MSASFPGKIAIENNVAAVMRDGTVLRADIYHPANGRKYPVLLCRTPYQKLSPRYVDHVTTLVSPRLYSRRPGPARTLRLGWRVPLDVSPARRNL